MKARFKIENTLQQILSLKMNDSRRMKIIAQQFNQAVKSPSEYIKYAMSDLQNTWYVLLFGFSGDNNEFEGGEYLVRVVLTDKFPYEPPQFYFMTENGLYGCETKVCISIGEYHKDQYRPVLGVSGFCEQLISGLIGWKSIGSGISIISTTISKKKALAEASKAANYHNHPHIMESINNSFAGYSAKWVRTEIPAPLLLKLGMVTQSTITAAEPVYAVVSAEPAESADPTNKAEMDNLVNNISEFLKTLETSTVTAQCDKKD